MRVIYPSQIDGEKIKGSQQSGNPVANNLNITVSLPESIEIKMVNASVLADYEIFLFISSAFVSVFVGFFTAYFQDTTKLYLLVNTLVFFVISIVFIIVTFRKRKSLNSKTKNIRLKLGDEITDKGVTA
jgi:F0F1-type ATP synthase assembly protein I